MQTKLESFLESLINVVIGYLIALVSQILIYPVFNIDVPIKDQMLLALFFTLISLVRGYVIRRYFNSHFNSTVKWLSGKLSSKLGGR